VTVTGSPAAESRAAERSAEVPHVHSLGPPEPSSGTSESYRLGTLLFAAGIYLFISLIVWSNVWKGHPTSTTTCGCGDISLVTWFLEWPAYALSHGLNPLYSTAMFHPAGVNLLANTSEVAIGVVLAPVTWIFGPIATLNVALTLAPVLSALAMFTLLARWVAWTPAALIGGLCYGFSPLILFNLDNAHLMLGMAVVPPLVVVCLDELLVRQQRRPVMTGILLGLLVVLQFFLGTELLFIVFIGAIIGILLVVSYGAWRHPEVLQRRTHYAVKGLSAGVIIAVVLLAYPAWFAMAGPAHISGSVWPGLHLGYEGTALKNLVVPVGAYPGLSNLAHRVGGYQGPWLSDQYFGFGLVAVLLGGVVAWRRDHRLWLFGAITVVAVVLSLGESKDIFLPWRVVAGLPLFQNIIPSRFSVISYLAVAVMLGLIVDHTYAAVSQSNNAAHFGLLPHSTDKSSSRPRMAGAAAGLVVAAIALGPIAAYLAVGIPVTTQPVVLPTWFRTIAPHLHGHQVILVLPAPFSLIQSAMTWQAVDQMHYSMVGGGGPEGVSARAGNERKGQTIVANTSYSLPPTTDTIDSGEITAVRHALGEWGVTMVVIPVQPDLPGYDRIPSVAFAAALVTAAIGQQPIRQANAWVWSGVDHSAPSVIPSTERFTECTAGWATRGGLAVDQATKCVPAASAIGHR